MKLGFLGSPLGSFGGPLGSLGVLLGSLGDHLGIAWDPLGHPLGSLEVPLGIPRESNEKQFVLLCVRKTVKKRVVSCVFAQTH